VTTPGRDVHVAPWTGSWGDDDRDANFKANVVLYAHADPLATLETLSRETDIPVGALVHYVLARWASAGSAALLEMGPSMVERLWEQIAHAEAAGTDDARLAAYDALRQMVSWLRIPLTD
jgi:pyruvoyl-dependent arginine decarboxylase (PvlArgDC)